MADSFQRIPLYESYNESSFSFLPSTEIDRCSKEAEDKKKLPVCAIKVDTDLAIKSRFANLRVSDQPDRLKELVNFTSGAPSGLKAMKQLIDMINRREIKVKFVDRKDMKHVEWGAQYNCDDKTIYLNKDLDIPILAPALIHEFKHAQSGQCESMNRCWEVFADKVKQNHPCQKCSEEEILKVADAALDRRESWAKLAMNNYKVCSHPIIFKGEREAFDSQLNFIDEMKKAHPCYSDYIYAQFRNKKIISIEVSNNSIIDLYDLDEKIVEDTMEPSVKNRGTSLRDLELFDTSEKNDNFDFLNCVEEVIKNNPSYLEAFKRYREAPMRNLMDMLIIRSRSQGQR